MEQKEKALEEMDIVLGGRKSTSFFGQEMRSLITTKSQNTAVSTRLGFFSPW